MDLFTLGQWVMAAYMVVLGLLCVYGAHRYFLVMTFYRVRRRPPDRSAPIAELPFVTVQLPMFNERCVARRIIESACRIDYPADRLEIQVLDDSTDDTVEIARETVERMRAAGHDVACLHRQNRVGYKAGALAVGTQQARGELILIFDADFVPPPNVLRETVPHFADPDVGMVQCRWDHLNRGDSVLTRAQAVLLDGHFTIEHTARNRSGRFMSFNGTAGVWRRTAIADAGGWQHDTLTEDLDLSYRAQLRGWRFIFLPDQTAPAELPPEMNAFKSQQHRWTKGGAQTCRKLLPRILASDVPGRVKLEAFFHLTSCVVYVLMVLLSILIGPALLAKLAWNPPESPWQLTLDMVLFTVGTGSAVAFYIASQLHLGHGWVRTLRTLPSLMSIGVGIALNNAIAAVEGFLFKAGEFVRTPKQGDRSADGVGSAHPAMAATVTATVPATRTRRVRGLWRSLLRDPWKAWIELGLALYLTLCLCGFFFFDHWFERISAAIPFMGLFIFGYAYVGVNSLRASWATARA